MHRITSLELLGTLIAGLEQNKQINRFQAHICWISFSVSERGDWIESKTEYMKSLFWNKGYAECRRQNLSLELSCSFSNVRAAMPNH